MTAEASKGKDGNNEPDDSIFAREQIGDNSELWWQRNFLLTKPALFGTWDGVFTTVMVNIFGIIIFLRMGWIVGTAGVANSIVLLIICTALALISVFSAIGICERCQIQSGGIYFLISHVLGGQIGGAVGLMYAFGQAVATGLVSIGFGESVARLLGTENLAVDRFIAITTLLILTGINMAGVRWVIRLQLLLLGFLSLAVIDFYLGALLKIDEGEGVGHFSSKRFDQNINSMYDGFNCSSLGFDIEQSHQNFFTVFGVFFANFLGVLAGVNMSDDLENPHMNIPLGELSAISVSSLISLSFILILGAMVDRAYLLCDSMIAEKVAFTGVLFLTGLYLSSLSSTVGSMIGTPRVIQSIASEGIIPILNPLAVGHGSNKSPLRATAVIMLIAVVFVLIGDLNQLATLSTMPFLITYAFVNYSHVSLAMSADLQNVNELRCTNEHNSDLVARLRSEHWSGVMDLDETQFTQGQFGTVYPIQNYSSENRAASKSYGSMKKLSEAGQPNSSIVSDLDQLFPERVSTSQSSKGGGGDAKSGQASAWYSNLSNRYISFVGAITNILIILFVNFWYAMLHLLALTALYFYIGRACPTVFPGISQFSLPHMFKTAFSGIDALGATSFAHARILISRDQTGSVPAGPKLNTSITPVNEDNADYQDRKQYHHTAEQHVDVDNLQ